VGTWMQAHVRGLRVGAVALAALLFVFLTQPTGLSIVLIAAGLLVVLAGIEFLARPGPAPVVVPATPGEPELDGGRAAGQEAPPVVVDEVAASPSLR
jgi:hypothetical protein